MPDYFTGNIDQAILLAPPASLAHCENALMKLFAPKTSRDLLLAVGDSIHLWSLLPYNYLESKTAVKFCELFDGKLCELVLRFTMNNDPTIDD